MEVSHREQIGRALESLGQALYSYIEQRMKVHYGEDWEKEVLLKLKEPQKGKQKKQKKQKNKDILREDVSILLRILIQEWNIFKDVFSQSDRALVSELIEVRNQWAHQSTFSTDDTYRAIDSTLRLIKSLVQVTDVDQPLIDEVNKQRQDVLRLLSQEQPRQETRVTSVSPTEEARIREGFSELLKRLPFRNAALLKQALTHTTYKYENPNTGEDNEQLEFLGDAVLQFLSTDFLYKRNPNLREGEMTDLRKNLVGNSRLAQFAEQLELRKWMYLGKGMTKNEEREKLLSGAFEAIVGAYYLDSGIEAVRVRFEPFFEEVDGEISITENTAPQSTQTTKDVKNQLQEYVLSQRYFDNPKRELPHYETDRVGGTDNAPVFTSVVSVTGRELGRGEGRSKKEAEKRAAEDALRKLGVR
ncbi:ribonuclease III [Trichothermofontia sp.]